METSTLLKFLTLKWGISRTTWRIEVSESSFFGIFQALSFELNIFRLEFSFNVQVINHSITMGKTLTLNEVDKEKTIVSIVTVYRYMKMYSSVTIFLIQKL